MDEALTDTPVVVLQGARQVGKSTLAASFVAQGSGRLVTLDDAPVREAALSDPTGFLESIDGLLVIDEVQRALNLADVAADAGFPARTLPPYLDLLETLYLTWRVPPWSTNLSNRIASRPKAVMLDCGLAARLINVSPESLHPTREPKPAGGLLEAFVLGELRRQAGWNEERARIFHYRDRGGAEIDIVLEHADGRVEAVEVKASTSIGADAFKWLAQLRDRVGDRFVQGTVLYTGERALSFGDRLTAQPIATLWRDHTERVSRRGGTARAPRGRWIRLTSRGPLPPSG